LSIVVGTGIMYSVLNLDIPSKSIMIWIIATISNLINFEYQFFRCLDFKHCTMCFMLFFQVCYSHDILTLLFFGVFFLGFIGKVLIRIFLTNHSLTNCFFFFGNGRLENFHRFLVGK